MLKVAEKPADANAPRDASGRFAATPEPVSYITESAYRRLAVWLDDLVQKSQGKPSAQIVSLTPELAAVLMDRNPQNRKISANIVESYAHEIEGNRWAMNGEPIIVSDTGELNDGQHRCEAVLMAKRPIDVLLIVGIKRDTRTTLDQGKTRSAGDYLSMEGNINTNVLAAAANLVWQYRNRGQIGLGGTQRATKGEVLDFVRTNRAIAKSVALVSEKGADAAGGKTLLAAAHFILGGIDHDDATHFVLSLIRGAGLKAGDPILYARNRLIRREDRMPQRMELVFRAWNAWRKRESLSRITLQGGILPVLEG